MENLKDITNGAGIKIDDPRRSGAIMFNNEFLIILNIFNGSIKLEI